MFNEPAHHSRKSGPNFQAMIWPNLAVITFSIEARFAIGEPDL